MYRGMHEVWDRDDDHFTFWPLHEFGRVSNRYPASFMEDQASRFTFADHLIGFPRFAIRLDLTSSPKLSVAGGIGRRDGHKPCNIMKLRLDRRNLGGGTRTPAMTCGALSANPTH